MSRLQQRLIAQYKRHPVEAYERKDGASVMSSEFLEQQTNQQQGYPAAAVYERPQNTHERDDRGSLLLAFLPGSVVKGITAVVGVGALGAGMGFGANFLDDFVQDHRSIDFGTAAVNKIELKLPKQCIMSFEADVTGTKAGFDRKVNIPDFLPLLGDETSTKFKVSKTFNGKLAVDTCNEKTAVTGKKDLETGKINLVFSADQPFTGKVYRLNPEDGEEFETDGGIATAYLGFAQKFISSVPDVGPVPKNVDGVSRLESSLEGMTLVAASELVTEGCAPKVYEAAKEGYSQILKEDYVQRLDEMADLLGTENPYSVDDITVDMPPMDEVKFTSQYDGNIKKLEQLDHITIDAGPDMLTRCEISEDVEIVSDAGTEG